MTATKTKSLSRLITFGLLLICLIAFPKPAAAHSGTPDSPKFGYGARLDPYGEDVALALKAAASIGIDWIAVDIDWARVWPNRNSDPDLNTLDFVMQKASRYELGMLVSITNPPRWAVTAKGPDQAATIRLVLLLAQRYPQNQLSIELFPAANTAQGWGAPPDPGAYSNLLKACWSALQSSGSPVLLVAGGLEPLPSKPSNGDMDDLVFLSKLYRSGAGGFMPIVSLRLPAVTADVLADPGDGSALVLRHYEAIRKVMSQYNHSSGLIWVTGYTYPAQDLRTVNEQAEWIQQSYQLMRSQLYIGAAFYDALIPPATHLQPGHLYLVRKDGAKTSLHPALATLAQLITLDRTGQTIPNLQPAEITPTGNK